MFSTKVRSTTATSFATASGKKPECIAGKGDYGDWPNSEGVSYTSLEHRFSLVAIGGADIE